MDKTRWRRKQGEALVAAPATAGSVPGRPVDHLDRRVVVASAILRNAVAIVGVSLLGWSAPEIVVLYFLDTLAAIWGIFTAVMFAFGDGGNRQSLLDRGYWWATALALSALVTAFLAIPLGMPVLFVAAANSWKPFDALAADGFRAALATVVLAGVVGAVFRSFQAAAGESGLHSMKWEFSLVFGRWFVVMAIMYSLGFLFLRYAAVVMVIAYASISVVTELYPQRFVRFFESRGRS